MKLFVSLLLLSLGAAVACAQGSSSTKQYRDMSRAERLDFVHEQARRIAREISGSDYEFTTGV
jgi:hypothetical protein